SARQRPVRLLPRRLFEGALMNGIAPFLWGSSGAAVPWEQHRRQQQASGLTLNSNPVKAIDTGAILSRLNSATTPQEFLAAFRSPATDAQPYPTITPESVIQAFSNLGKGNRQGSSGLGIGPAAALSSSM